MARAINQGTPPPTIITHNGITQTLREWADETGIHIETIRSRLKNNWSVKEALTFGATRTNRKKGQQPTMITHNGKTQTLQQWADEVGVAKDTLRHRLKKRGWPLERALSYGAQIHVGFRKGNNP